MGIVSSADRVMCLQGKSIQAPVWSLGHETSSTDEEKGKDKQDSGDTCQAREIFLSVTQWESRSPEDSQIYEGTIETESIHMDELWQYGCRY